MRPMRCITADDLSLYLRHDLVARMLNLYAKPGDDRFASHRWLCDSPPKRMIFDELYGDLLRPDGVRRNVLDVGGGLTALTRPLAQRHDYLLLDILAHDEARPAEELCREIGRKFWISGDWFDHKLERPVDLIIANDLFPNVDQRLKPFLQRMLPRCRELRISLTFYNNTRYYFARRLNADEILCVLAYDAELTAAALRPFVDRIERADIASLSAERPSVYSNGRQIALAYLRGDWYDRAADGRS